MEFVKEVSRAQMIPKWYGVAWVLFERDIAICLPIPINVVAGVARSFIIWMRYCNISVPLNCRDAYAQGLRDARREQESKQVQP